MSDSEAFLGVTRSLRGQAWYRRAFLPRVAEALASATGQPLLAGELMASRGVTPDTAPGYLNPTLKADLPDPSTITDMARAAARLADTVERGGTVGVFGDYDVDGATSTALLVRYITAVGGTVVPYIPDRMREGYGPNLPGLMTLKERGADLVITVDCGTLSYEPLAGAKAAGLDVIVCDHHKAEMVLPEAVAVVNPNRLDDESGLTQLAAVGVTFMLLVALNAELRERGFFKSRKSPNLLSLLDIVALGTVCDVVPLTGLNRTFVRQGLKVMGERRNVGLRALADVARMDEAPSTYHLGFLLGPRINAGGRVGESDLGTRLLTTENEDEARSLAKRLDHFNEDRRAIEQEVQAEALAQLAQHADDPTLALAVGAGWHPGVIGIVASRLKEKYGVPSLVLAIDKGIAKGSARSIAGVDLGSAVIDAASAGLLINGGGHAMAAGLTVAEDLIPDLKAFLKDRLADSVAKARETQALKVDGLIAAAGLTARLVDQIEAVGPYGVGNPNPRFVLEHVTIVSVDTVGQNHLRLRVKGRDGKTVKAMAFRATDEDWGQELLAGLGKTVHLVGRIKKDSWAGGNAAEFHVEDAAWAGLSAVSGA